MKNANQIIEEIEYRYMILNNQEDEGADRSKAQYEYQIKTLTMLLELVVNCMDDKFGIDKKFGMEMALRFVLDNKYEV